MTSVAVVLAVLILLTYSAGVFALIAHIERPRYKRSSR